MRRLALALTACLAFSAAQAQSLKIIGRTGGPVAISLCDKEGAFSIRAFADVRPGPRHVRDLAEIRIDLR